MIQIVLRCKVHPRYKGIRPPKLGLDCLGCNCSGVWFVRQAVLQVIRGVKTTDVSFSSNIVKSVS